MRERHEVHVVRRDRALARAGREPVVLVEAPGGFGKSSFAVQLAAVAGGARARAVMDDSGEARGAIRHALRRSGAAGLAHLVDTAGPVELADAFAASDDGFVLVVDEVQRVGDADRRWLVELAGAMVAPGRLVLVGRRLGRDLVGLVSAGVAVRIDTDDLRFDRNETADVLRAVVERALADDEIDEVQRLTDGWPAAVVLAGARLATTGHLPSAAGSGSLAELVERQLATATAPTRALVRELAHVPLLSTELARRVDGDGAFDRLLDLGLPIRFRRDGWGELSDPVREHLTAEHRPADRTLVLAADLYARRGELPTAVDLLARWRLPGDLADLLVGLPRSLLVSIGLSRLDALLTDVPDEVLRSRAEVLVRLALAADRIDPPRRQRWLDRADRIATEPAVRRAIAVEQTLDLGRHHRSAEALARFESLRDACGADETLTLGRIALGIGLVRLVVEQGSASDLTIAEIDRAASLFHEAGEYALEALALRASGFGAHFNRGAFETATDHLGRAVALLAAPDENRAVVLTFVAEVDRDLGRLDAAESALHESLAIGRRLGSDVAISYAAWQFALVAGERRDRAAVGRWSAETEAHGAEWLDLGAGVDYHAQMAELLLQCGDVETALDHLSRAEDHPSAGDYAWPSRSARARYEAMHGDPGRGEDVLDELDAIAPQRERPLRLLLRAVCASRRGDQARSAVLLADAETASVAIGDPSRLARREPELLAMVRPAEPDATTAAPTSIRMLGQFTVTTGADVVTPPPGRAATLVKLVALRGALTVEAAIDVLWDDCDVDTGRARLRNLLNRVRTASGTVIERDAELLRLAPSIEVDAARFELAAARALDAEPAVRVGAARAALAVYGGDLLPGDAYDDWAVGPRERLRRRHLALVDLVARDALERLDLDEATRLLDLGIEAEPFDLWRYVAAASALWTQGRRRAAEELARRALDVADELGVDLDPPLSALAAGRTPDW